MLTGPASPPGSSVRATGELFEEGAQRAIGGQWARMSAGLPGEGIPSSLLRPAILSSWSRSRAAGIPADLGEAPTVLEEEGLALTARHVDWLPLVNEVLEAQARGFIAAGNIMAVFDGDGRMLRAEGDPGALEGLAEINFAPGALWTETAAGTNGPGTALALKRPVHVVGREHFCQAWQSWHCAAAPIRDPASGEILGVIDLSGPVGAGSPYALTLATAFAVALEQRLSARAAQDQARILTAWADLVARYPADGVLAVAPDGRVLARSRVPARCGMSSVGDVEGSGSLQSTSGAAGIGWLDRSSGPPGIPRAHVRIDGQVAQVHPVVEGTRILAACIVVPRRTTAPTHPGAQRARSSTSTVRRNEGRSGRGGTTRYTLDDLVGASPGLREVRRLARACARTDLPVLLLGASGTGKELLAQGIHAAGPRASAPFIPVNCGALPRELVISELFGYVGGAFSGARNEGADGKFHAADGGTLFLDEVGELPLEAQAALLRALQEGVVTRVGAHHGEAVQVRVIAATNRDLAAGIADGTFREDLFHRLAGLTVEIPTLAERAEDIPAFLAYYLAEANASLAVPRRFSPEAKQALGRYAWPGNVRELRNLVRRLVVLADGPVVGLEDLPTVVRAATAPASETGRVGPGKRHPGETEPVERPLTRTELERQKIEAAITAHATMGKAAESLGITRSTLYRRMARLGLEPGRAARRTS